MTRTRARTSTATDAILEIAAPQAALHSEREATMVDKGSHRKMLPHTSSGATLPDSPHSGSCDGSCA